MAKKIFNGSEQIKHFAKIQSDEETWKIENTFDNAYNELGNAKPNWSTMYLYTSGEIFNKPGFQKIIKSEIIGAMRLFDEDVDIECKTINPKNNLATCTIKESNTGDIYSIFPIPLKQAEIILKKSLNEMAFGYGGYGVEGINKIVLDL